MSKIGTFVAPFLLVASNPLLSMIFKIHFLRLCVTRKGFAIAIIIYLFSFSTVNLNGLAEVVSVFFSIVVLGTCD